jgi:hypothetical protein
MEITLEEALFPVRHDSESFHPEDAGNMLLRNVSSYKSHTASSYPRRHHSSLLPLWKHEMLHSFSTARRPSF